MIKAMKPLFLMLVLAAGIVFAVSGCSSDDDMTSPLDTDIPVNHGVKEVTDTVNPLGDAAKTLNGEMAALTFNELTPLTDVVSPTTRGEGDEAFAEFERKLSALLDILKTTEGSGRRSATLGHRFSFQAFNDALKLAWEMSVTLSDQGDSSSSWFGLNSTKEGEVNYNAGDGNQYTVKGVIDKDTWVKFRGFKTEIVVTRASEFYIYKNGEQVIKMVSSSDCERPIWLPVIINDVFYTGQMYYRDYEINLTYDKNSSHRRTIDLTYGKANKESPILIMTICLEDDADIPKIVTHDVNVKADLTVKALEGNLVFYGDIKNVNYLVVDGVKLSKCMKEGTTEEECKRIVTEFNDNLTLSIELSGNSVGNIFMDSQYDAVTGLYYPTIMLHSSMLGSNDYRLTKLLEMLGVDVPDILKNVAEINNATE